MRRTQCLETGQGLGFILNARDHFEATDRHIAWHLAAHVALCSETARERVAHVLLALAPLIGQRGPDGIELDVTNQELADSTKYQSLHHKSPNQRMAENWDDS